MTSDALRKYYVNLMKMKPHYQYHVQIPKIDQARVNNKNGKNGTKSPHTNVRNWAT
jgi:hypothetical protein